jgi:ribonuclease P protein component, eubacterial
MKKKFRVKKNQEFQTIIKNKRYITSREFVVYYKRNQYGYMRIGVSVSKKLGNAVVRNKVKRQVKEMIKPLFIYNLSYDVIIILRNQYLNNDFIQNKTSLTKLFKRINFNEKEIVNK